MISGISSPGGFIPQSLVTKAKTAAQPQQVPTPDVPSETQSSGVRAPEGDEQALTQELNLFDLANRQFAEILPRLELANSPVE